MKGNRIWLLLLVLILVGIFGFFAFKWMNGDIVAVKSALVSEGPIEQVVSASGIIDAPLYNLGTKMGGKIAVWHVKEGDVVKKGQLLAEFDSYEQARNDFERTKQLFDEDAASQQQFDAAKTLFENSRIVSPNDGMVSKRNYEEGETVVPGVSAVEVVNYDKSWVEGQIDEVDIANVKIGDYVKITSDVYPDKVYTGEVNWIAPVAELRKVGGRVKMDEESYVFPCKIKFLGAHSELKVNMSVNIDVTAKSKISALLIPREALYSKDDTTYVYKIRKNNAYLTKVTTGIRSFASIEALSGVFAGDQLAASNLSKLKDKGRISLEQ